jgi:hypothetical protein
MSFIINEQLALKCPKCGCHLDDPTIGRHSDKWFVKHPLMRSCQYAGKHWGFHETKDQASAAVAADDSNWRPLDHGTLAFVDRQIGVEYDKLQRAKRKGYLAE